MASINMKLQGGLSKVYDEAVIPVSKVLTELPAAAAAAAALESPAAAAAAAALPGQTKRVTPSTSHA